MLSLLVALALPASAQAALSLEPVGEFTAPIYATAPPGDASRLFVVERGGTVRVVKDGVTLSTPFLTIGPGELSTDGERGLLAMTFDADYATSGRLFTYSTDAGGDIRVDLWHRSAAILTSRSRGGRSCCASSTACAATTTAVTCASARTASSTSRPATAAGETIPTTTARH